MDAVEESVPQSSEAPAQTHEKPLAKSKKKRSRPRELDESLDRGSLTPLHTRRVIQITVEEGSETKGNRSNLTSSDSAKLNMQEKTDSNQIDQTKETTRDWRKVKIWGNVKSNNGTPAFQEKAHPFKHNESHIGVQPSEFERLHKHDPCNFFLRMLGKTTPGVGHSTLNQILNATNDYISVTLNDESKICPPTRKIGGKPEGECFIGSVIPARGYVTGGELVSFLGIQFIMGYHRLPKLHLFWEQQPDSGLFDDLGIIQQTMTRERYKFISKHITCGSPSSSPVDIEEEHQDPDNLVQMSKILPLIELLNCRFQECRHPPKWQSIDESMINFKDHSTSNSILMQSMKNNLLRRKFTMLSRCDDRGYTYQCKIYHASRTEMSHRNEAEENVVIDLCLPLAEQGHIVAIGRFLTSVDLMSKLYNIGVNAVGMILSNRANQPPMSTNALNLKPGKFVAKFGGEPTSCRKGLFIYKDTNKSIRLISNYHGSDIIQVQKQRDGTYKDEPCPKAIDDYLKNMGGVDTANQLRSHYERDPKANHNWWNRLFYSLMETTLVNSWICFNDLVSSNHYLIITHEVILFFFC